MRRIDRTACTAKRNPYLDPNVHEAAADLLRRVCMKKQLRDRRSIEGVPLERAFSDFEAMEPAGGERRTRKPAKATIASADTRSQRRAATRARTAGPNPTAEQRRKSSSSRSRARKASDDPAVRKSRHERPT